MRSSLALSFFALLAAQPALADTFDVASKVDAVTLYQDAATVERRISIDLPAGAHVVKIANLSSQIELSSLRVSGEGDGALVIGATDLAAVPPDAKPLNNVSAKLQELRNDKTLIETHIEALNGKRAMMQNYAEAVPTKVERDGKPLDVNDWPKLWDMVGNGLMQVGEELRVKKAKLKDIETEIALLEVAARPSPRAVRLANHQVSINVSAAKPMKATLVLSYRIASARWTPHYDVRLATKGADGKPSVEIVRRAEITQSSGEDWNDVMLTVSTARAFRGTAMPDVQPQRLNFPQPPEMYGGHARAKSAAPPAPAAMRAAPDDKSEAVMAEVPKPQMQAATEQQSQLASGAYIASFIAPERVSVAGNGSMKMVRLGTKNYLPALVVRTAPALDETAYLEAKIVNEEDAPLLAGPVSVFRDGDYVGIGQMAFTPPTESTTLGFGPDDRVKVTRLPVKRKENEPTWFGQSKTEAREFKTTVKNLHDFAIKVAVVDQVPISENTAIVIETLGQTTPPSEKNMDGKRGLLGWNFDLKPQEAKELRLSYRMKWPADRDIIIESVPVGSP